MQSVDRALDVLDILARDGELGVGEVSVRLGVHKSTASRLLATLESRGLVERGADGAFGLGLSLVRLAGAATERFDLARSGTRACRELAAAVGETADLAVLDGRAAVNLCEARGPSAIAMGSWLGRSTPLHCTSSGKVLLAFGPEDLRASVVGAPLAAVTPRSVVSGPRLDAELSRVREHGWASTAGEYEEGLHAVAAPVFAAGRELAGALSVSAPSYRLPESAFADVADQVVAAAAALGRRLGAA